MFLDEDILYTKIQSQFQNLDQLLSRHILSLVPDGNKRKFFENMHQIHKKSSKISMLFRTFQYTNLIMRINFINFFTISLNNCCKIIIHNCNAAICQDNFVTQNMIYMRAGMLNMLTRVLLRFLDHIPHETLA